MIFLSINQVGRPKVTINDIKELTEIIIANSENEITVVMYQKQTELDGINFPVEFHQNIIDGVFF